jgi:uncharacterized protein YrrD
MLRQVKDILNFRLGADDGEIGRVKDLYFDDESWTGRYLVADTGTWLPGRLVLISPVSLGHANLDKKVLKVNLTRRQIEASPSVECDKPVSRQHEVDYARYYGWPMYWYGPALWGPTPYPVYERGPGEPPASDPMVRPEQSGDPHLRSAKEVIGYHIRAQDDEIGHVEDLIVEEQDWAVRYLVVDTRNWLPGKKVLLAPQWIEEVSWERSRVIVPLTTDAIRNAPEYDGVDCLTRDYEERLYRHYRREGYWAARPEMAKS